MYKVLLFLAALCSLTGCYDAEHEAQLIEAQTAVVYADVGRWIVASRIGSRRRGGSVSDEYLWSLA